MTDPRDYRNLHVRDCAMLALILLIKYNRAIGTLKINSGKVVQVVHVDVHSKCYFAAESRFAETEFLISLVYPEL